MKNLFFLSILAAVMVFGSASANASSIEFQYMMLDADIDVFGFEPTALQIKFVNPMDANITVEGIVAFGIGDDDISFTDGVNTISFGIGLGTMFGIYGRVQSADNSSVQFYGHLGFVKIEYDFSRSTSFSGSSFTADASEMGLA